MTINKIFLEIKTNPNLMVAAAINYIQIELTDGMWLFFYLRYKSFISISGTIGIITCNIFNSLNT
jgi:hypothetical protein